MKRLYILPALLAAILLNPSFIVADQIQPLLDVGSDRQQAEEKSQSKIDQTDDDTSLIVNEFKTVSKQIEGLRVYNAQLTKQIEAQEARLKEIDRTMKEARIMQRRERIAFAKAAIDNPTVSPAEGLRQVLEAYEVEAEYGRKIDTYKDTIEIDGQPREVNILRVGRLALLYQTSDADETGAWNNKLRQWEELGGSYRNPARLGLRIANKLATVDMIEVPVQNAEVPE